MEGRRQEILDLVNQQGEVSLTALKERFPYVSEVTLRKDLKFLDAEHQLIRIHGGAKSIRSAYTAQENYYMRYAESAEEKKIIGQKAAALLKPYDSFYLAAGSTCSGIAQELPNIPLRIFTDGMETAIRLAKLKNLEITILGGELAASGMQTVGPKVLRELEELRLDYAFCGTLSYSIGYGFGCHSVHTFTLGQVLRTRVDKMVIVMDSSKVNKVRAVRNLREKDIDIVISDGKLDEEIVAYLKKNHVKVL